MKKGFFTLVMAAAVLGCAATPPENYSNIRYEISDHDSKLAKMRAGGIALNTEYVSETPQEFQMSLPQCDRGKGRELDETEIVDSLPPKNLLFKVTFTNMTTHVARLPLAVVTLRDPVGNMNTSLTQNEIEERFIRKRGCRLSDVAADRFKTLRMITQNTILVPGRTTSGYFVFVPHDYRLPGVWTLSIHEVPVTFDDAGRTKKTDSLEQQFFISKYADLFVRLTGETDYTKATKDITKGGSEEQELMEFVRLREAERAAAEKAAQEKVAREKEEAEKVAREKEEAERLAEEKEEAEEAAREKEEAERLAKEGEKPNPVTGFFKNIFSSGNNKGTQ